MKKMTVMLLMAGFMSGCAGHKINEQEDEEIKHNLEVMKMIIDQTNKQQAQEKEKGRS